MAIAAKPLNSALQLGMAVPAICALFDCDEEEIEAFVQREFGQNLSTYRGQLLARYELNARIAAANFAKGVTGEEGATGDEQVLRANAKKLFQPLRPAPEALITIGGIQLPVTQVRTVELREDYDARHRGLVFYLVLNRTNSDTVPLANTVIPFLTSAARQGAITRLEEARRRAELPARR